MEEKLLQISRSQQSYQLKGPWVSVQSAESQQPPGRRHSAATPLSDLRSGSCDRPPTWLSLVLTDDRRAASSCQLTSGKAKRLTPDSRGRMKVEEAQGEREGQGRGGTSCFVFPFLLCFSALQSTGHRSKYILGDIRSHIHNRCMRLCFHGRAVDLPESTKRFS